MKRRYMLLLAPLILAIQCDDDVNTGFETTYQIANNSAVDLYYLTPDNSFTDVPSNSAISIGSDLNAETNPIAPSDTSIFSEVRLYKNDNDSFILVYSQSPLDSELWDLTEPSENRFEYTLTITNNDID